MLPPLTQTVSATDRKSQQKLKRVHFMCNRLDYRGQYQHIGDADVDNVAVDSPEDLLHLFPAAERKERGRSDDQDSWTSKEPNSQVMPADPPPSSSSKAPGLKARARRFTVRHRYHRNSVCISQWAIPGPLAFSWNSDIQFNAKRCLEKWWSMWGNSLKGILGAFPLKWKSRQKTPLPLTGCQINRPGSQASLADVAVQPRAQITCIDLVFLLEVMKMKSLFKKWSLGRTVHASQSLDCGWRALLSAACPVTGLYSGLSSVVSLIPGCRAGTKRPFTLTLTHGHPHHHRNQLRGIHSSSLISISVYPWQTVPALGWGEPWNSS